MCDVLQRAVEHQRRFRPCTACAGGLADVSIRRAMLRLGSLPVRPSETETSRPYHRAIPAILARSLAAALAEGGLRMVDRLCEGWSDANRYGLAELTYLTPPAERQDRTLSHTVA